MWLWELIWHKWKSIYLSTYTLQFCCQIKKKKKNQSFSFKSMEKQNLTILTSFLFPGLGNETVYSGFPLLKWSQMPNPLWVPLWCIKYQANPNTPVDFKAFYRALKITIGILHLKYTRATLPLNCGAMIWRVNVQKQDQVYSPETPKWELD